MMNSMLSYAENVIIENMLAALEWDAQYPQCIKELFQYIKARNAADEVDLAQLSLLFCIVTGMDENGSAPTESIKRAHSARMYGDPGFIAGELLNTVEYLALKKAGFIYEVLWRGSQRRLKFQRPYSLEMDNKLQRRLARLLQRSMSSNTMPDMTNWAGMKAGTAARALFSRVCREFGGAAYIGDIQIDAEEYKQLKEYLNTFLDNPEADAADPFFATAVVQVALRAYREHNFWTHFFEELGRDNNVPLQGIIGRRFYAVLTRWNKFRVSSGRYIQNILLHCYVSNYYSHGYFEFLYKFYSLDMDRNIQRLNGETLNLLIEYICSEGNEGRRYMLAQHFSLAVAADKLEGAARIRTHLELMDKLFWDPEYPVHANDRLCLLLKEWAGKSEDMCLGARMTAGRHTAGKKRFTWPHLFFDRELGCIRLVLPSQIIERHAEANIFWQISGEKEMMLVPEIVESIAGFKAIEASIELAWQNALDPFRITLMGGDKELKSFPVSADKVRFFDGEGYPISAGTLRTGEVIAVSREEETLRSTSLLESYTVDGMRISCFDFAYEDILMLPDGGAVMVGRKEVHNGLGGKGWVRDAELMHHDESYKLYREMPNLVLRMPREKATGTSIELNNRRLRMQDADVMEFAIDDLTGENGYYIDLSGFCAGDGLCDIIADIPGSMPQRWKFLLASGFEAEFKGAPYIFEPLGTIRFSDAVTVRSFRDGTEALPEKGAYGFDIESTGRHIEFDIEVDGEAYILSLPVPAVFLRFSDGAWSSRSVEHLWHADLPDTIDLSLPYNKVKLGMRDASTGRVLREIEYQKTWDCDYISCDIRRFKSYLSGAGNLRTFYASFGETDTELFAVLIHNIAISCEMIGDFETGAITVKASIAGKNPCCADIYRNAALVAEKLRLEDGCAVLQGAARNGEYAIELYEVEEDDAGFGENEYYLIGKYKQALIDPHDMSGRDFRIIRIEGKTIYPLHYDYYVSELQKAGDKHNYSGRLTAYKKSGTPIASFPVKVEFKDLESPELAYLVFRDEDIDKDFLYDTRRKGFLKMENPRLSRLEKYRRYMLLDPSTDSFRINFCSAQERVAAGDLPGDLVFEEASNTMRFVSTGGIRFVRERGRMGFYDIAWRQDVTARMHAAGIRNMEDITAYDRDGLRRVLSASDEMVDYIEQTMAVYGYKFKQE